MLMLLHLKEALLVYESKLWQSQYAASNHRTALHLSHQLLFDNLLGTILSHV
jgi:hypothetical protein